MVTNYWKNSPPSCYDGETTNRPDPDKPRFSNVERGYEDNIFANALYSILDHIPEQQLEGWVYHDPFLRFLYSIGLKNAALIMTLQFHGVPKMHVCRHGGDCWKVCPQDLVNSLRIYVLFIKHLCTGLRKLIIQVEGDPKFDAAVAAVYADELPSTKEEALRPFLENELRIITSINELQVIDGDRNEMQWAQDTVQWVGRRAEERKKLKWEEEKKRKGKQAEAEAVRAANIHCAFCGEGHLWAECYNLCPYCGGYGHLRETCPVLKEHGGE